MKFELIFELEKNEIPLDYSRCFVSFLKNTLEKGNPEIYRNLYKSEAPIIKPYTFSLYLPGRRVEKNSGTLALNGMEIRMTLSCGDISIAVAFLNGLMSQKGVAFPFPNKNSLKLIKFHAEECQKVNSEEVTIRFLSPLLVLKHQHQDKRNIYLTWKDEEFNSQLQKNVAYQIKQLTNQDVDVSKFQLTPVLPKRIGQRVFGQLVLGNTGIYKLKAPIEVLQLLSEIGIGSRRSEGFGFFEIIE